MATIRSLPAKRQETIIQGSAWPGATVQFINSITNLPEELTVTGQVRTDTVDRGGVLLAECDVATTGDPADYKYLVSLDEETTRSFPERQLFIEIDAARAGEAPQSVLRFTVTVEGEYNAPEPPVIGTATAGVGQATVTWTAPTVDGGSAVTSYVVTPYIAGTAQTPVASAGTGTSKVVTGLTAGVAYTFKVAAVNAYGTGPRSGASNSVTPT